MRFRTIVVMGAATLPDMSFAMGGEGIAESLLKGAGILVLWVVATIISFFGKRKRFEGAWFLAWAVRLSLPITILWTIFLDPVFDKMEDKGNAQKRSERMATFAAECKVHATSATSILHVESTERPKTVYVEEPAELFGPEISRRLINCIQGRAPACQEIALDSVEWARKHSTGFQPCRAGVEPSHSGQCVEFNRTDFGADRIKPTPIDKPASQYIIRVEQKANTFELGEIRRYYVTLESLRTAQVLARTELLMSGEAPPCQNFETEIARMLTRSFSAR